MSRKSKGLIPEIGYYSRNGYLNNLDVKEFGVDDLLFEIPIFTRQTRKSFEGSTKTTCDFELFVRKFS